MAYPQQKLDEVPGEAVKEIVTDLRQLHAMGRPQTDEEVEERVNDYFKYCQESSVRPGIESLCLALHISRTTLFRWSKGVDCSPRRQEIIESAKMFITTFLEQCMMSGRINPASGIFLLKNWASYRDTISFESEIQEPRRFKTMPTRDEFNASMRELGIFDENNQVIMDNNDDSEDPYDIPPPNIY